MTHINSLPEVLRAIYTGRSSALEGYRAASKSSAAENNEMREVFAEAVAYAAVQVTYLEFLTHILPLIWSLGSFCALFSRKLDRP